jgi:CHAT domain-containing protein
MQGTSRPRLWWLPTGPLTFLPLHAAGVYTGKATECLSDYAVSSYVPTLSALAQARSRPTDGVRSSSRMLLLAPIENSSDLPQLPHALAEVSLIEALVASEAVMQDDAPDQTVDSVLRLIPQADIVHFACHGRQINADPLQSGFELSDGRLTLSHLMRLHIPRGQLAYLSACESAAVDANQPDEAVNIATAMLYVGFKSVIATLWYVASEHSLANTDSDVLGRSMNDVDGPFVAKRVYSNIFEDGRLDLAAVPYALDDAVTALRKSGVSASRWATYVHVGA